MNNADNVIEKIYERYHNDAAGFTTRFTSIFTEPDTGKRQKLYPLQIEFLNLLKPTDKVSVVLKCRQSGFSTSIKARSVHRSFFKKTPQILIASTGINASMKVLRDIKSGFESMPEFMRPAYKKETETTLILENGVEIHSLPFNPETTRGWTGDVFLDEFSMKSMKDSKEIWSSLAPSITKMGNIAVVSTPKGKDNMFYQLCNNYLNPIDPATGEERVPRPNKLIQVHWSQVPHVKANIDELRKLFHPEEFLQEYELQFLDSVESSMFTYNFMMEKVVDQRQEPVQIIELGFLDYVEGYDLPPSMVKKDIVSKYPGGIFMGYDIAMTGDGSICGVFGITEDDTWELISYKKFRSGTDLNEQIRIVCLMAQVFNAKKLVYDSTGALGKAAMGVIKNTPIKNISKPFEFTQKSKSVGYAELRLKMEKEGFKIPNIQECIKEFSNLGINPVTGRIGAQGSHRNHDDWPSMFMMAYHGRKKGIVEPAFTFL